MRQTANYQLPLWDAADRILREDFNRGNQKIAEALDGKLDLYTLLDVTTTVRANRVDVDLSKLRLADYQILFMDITLPGSGYMGLFFNDSGYSPQTSCGLVQGGPGIPLQAFLFPMQNGAGRVGTIGFSQYASIGMAQCSYAQVTTLNIKGQNENYYAEAGSKIVIRGVK